MAKLITRGICRCCLAEGTFKDVKTKYHWMGDVEVYADMLKDCLDVSLFLDGCDESGICDACITQLRNAVNFKKQVLHTERQFLQAFAENSFQYIEDDHDIKNESTKDEIENVYEEDDQDEDRQDVKMETFKPEKIEEFTEDDCDVLEEYLSSEHDTEDEPERPKPAIKKRAAKRTAASKSKKSKSARDVTKRIGLKEEETRVTTNNGVDDSRIKTSEEIELAEQRRNIRLILECSNATPIRGKASLYYGCDFCSGQFIHPAELKQHILEEHRKNKLQYMSKVPLADYMVKIDITALRCELCESDMDSLGELISHLIDDHSKMFNTEINDHLIPFKFDDDVDYKCVICSEEFDKFRVLLQHMHSHYRNYVCTTCDAGFVSYRRCLIHTRSHKSGIFECRYCPEVFTVYHKRVYHEKSVHTFTTSMKCYYCNEYFKSYGTREKHMLKVHKVKGKTFTCDECSKNFITYTSFRMHLQSIHSERKHRCLECGKAFPRASELKTHKLRHSGLKNYQCDICKKRFRTKNQMLPHMRIHMNVPIYKCSYCTKSFFYKNALKRHVEREHV